MHIKTSILAEVPILAEEAFTTKIEDELSKTIKSFEIKKLKVFSGQGVVVYSTDEEDLGKTTNHGYFWDTVAKGNVFSKIVEKGQHSAEGKIIKRDVAEVYVPIMNKNGFFGALEIYYDITEAKQKLDRILTYSSHLLYSLASLMFLF